VDIIKQISFYFIPLPTIRQNEIYKTKQKKSIQQQQQQQQTNRSASHVPPLHVGNKTLLHAAA